METNNGEEVRTSDEKWLYSIPGFLFLRKGSFLSKDLMEGKSEELTP
jgi:hypothetical protein